MANKTGIHYKPYERLEQQNRAQLAWMRGDTIRDIATDLDVSTKTAHDRIQQAIDAMRPHAEYDRYRAVQLTELEVSRMFLRKVIVTAHTLDTGDTAAEAVSTCFENALKAIGSLIKLQEREAKLLGLDKVTTPIDDLTNLTDAEIAAMIEEWAEIPA